MRLAKLYDNELENGSRTIEKFYLRPEGNTLEDRSAKIKKVFKAEKKITKAATKIFRKKRNWEWHSSVSHADALPGFAPPKKAKDSVLVSLDSLTIPAKSRVRVDVRTFSLTQFYASPEEDENMRLVPAEDLVHAYILPVYRALLAYEARNPADHDHVQGLIWAMRDLHLQRDFRDDISPKQKQILDEALPGGAQKFQKYLDDLEYYAAIDDVKRSLVFRDQTSYAQMLDQYIKYDLRYAEKIEKHFRYVNYASADSVKTALRQLKKAKARGSDQEKFGAVLLDNGLAVSVVHPGGARYTKLDIINPKGKPVQFRPAEYVAFPNRKAAPLSLHIGYLEN